MLPLAAVPPRLLPAFAPVQQTIFHWIGFVRKISPGNWKETEKVAIVGDAALYVCDDDASISRCLVYADMSEVMIRDDDDSMGFRMGPKGEHDAMLRFGQRDFETVLSMVRKIYWAHMGREIKIVRLGPVDPIQPHLSLEKRMDWTLKVEPLKPRKFLEKLLSDQSVAYQKDVDSVHTEFMRIKNELNYALESARNQQYDRMVRQTASYVQQLAQKDGEVQMLKAELERAQQFVLDTNASRAIQRTLARLNPTFVPDGGASGGAAPTGGATASFARDAHTREGGDAPEAECTNCSQLRQLLESHPNADKRRVLAAEESLTAAEKELKTLHRTTAPLADDVKALRDALKKAGDVLLDQRLTLQDRVRAASQVTTPYTVGGKKPGGAPASSGQSMTVPPAPDVTTLTEELLTLRGVLRDASALHMAELDRLRAEFNAYDEAMVTAVRTAMEASGTVAATSQVRTQASNLVSAERSRVLAQIREGSASPLRARGASPPRSTSRYVDPRSPSGRGASPPRLQPLTAMSYGSPIPQTTPQRSVQQPSYNGGLTPQGYTPAGKQLFELPRSSNRSGVRWN